MVEHSTVRIRRAGKEDADDIYRIHTAAIREICSACYSEEEIKCWWTRQSRERYLPFIWANEMIVAVDGERDKIVGFGHLRSVAPPREVGKAFLGSEKQNKFPDQTERQIVGDKMERDIHIQGLFVEPESGGKGVGKALMESLERRALSEGAVQLTVYSTLNAVTFYEKCGFACKENTTHEISRRSLQCWKMIKYLA